MIYILSGNDTKSKRAYVSTLVSDGEVLRLSSSDVSKELLEKYSQTKSLFDDSPVVIIENMLGETECVTSAKEMEKLSSSSTLFILLEDALPVAVEKKYTKHATIIRFDEKIVSEKTKINTFAIADAFARRDKMTAWIEYGRAVDAGIEPEALSGILFWKIKVLLLDGSRVFSHEELARCSSRLVSLYHRSHRGDVDFTIGLEQYLLESLSPVSKK